MRLLTIDNHDLEDGDALRFHPEESRCAC